jgi:CHAD domain-containing protein
MTDTFEPVAAPPPVELELTYRVEDVAGAEHYLTAPRIGAFDAHEPAKESRIEDRYVDTDDGAMALAGYVVRLRHAKSGTTVSVKSLGHTQGPGGAVRREELEGPADLSGGPSEWPTSAARSVVMEHAGTAPLVEVVTLRQVRRRRQIRDAGTRIELSLDEVTVIARDREVGRFAELEAELRRGAEGRLAELTAIFDADPALAPAETNKLETALVVVAAAPATAEDEVEDQDEELAPDDPGDTAAEPPEQTDDEGEGLPDLADFMAISSTSDDSVQSPEPPDDARLVVGKSPGVTAEDHVGEAGRKVLRFHLARMLAREAGTREGIDAEELHAMRVATRRQRAAWRVFGASFRPGRTKRYRNGLREIASRLGTVRDLDVLLEAVDAYRADLPAAEGAALEPMLRDWRGRRDDARVLLIRELDSPRYQRWVDDYRDFVRTEGAAVVPVGPTQPHRVRDTAPSHIWAAYEQVRAYEPVLRWADVETLHELRIAGKWLRYTLEFVREALEPEVTPLLARVTALQDHLGLMNDADVAASMARTFLVEHAGELSALESAAIGR